MRFYLKGVAALVGLLLLTLLMEPDPSVTAVRALIIGGLAIAGLKMFLRHRGIDWPRRRR